MAIVWPRLDFGQHPATPCGSQLGGTLKGKRRVTIYHLSRLGVVGVLGVLYFNRKSLCSAQTNANKYISLSPLLTLLPMAVPLQAFVAFCLVLFSWLFHEFVVKAIRSPLRDLPGPRSKGLFSSHMPYAMEWVYAALCAFTWSLFIP
jgi:hypothetical protein